MKTRLLCWSLLLASAFALAACNKTADENAEPGAATPSTAPTAPTEPTMPPATMPPASTTTTPPPSTTTMPPPTTMPSPTSTSPTGGAP